MSHIYAKPCYWMVTHRDTVFSLLEDLMKFEDIFEIKAPPDTDSKIQQLAAAIVGVMPLNEDGDIDWHEVGALIGDKSQELLHANGIETADGPESLRVVTGAAIALIKTLHKNRSQFLTRSQMRDLSIFLGFCDSVGVTQKIMTQILSMGFKE